MKRFTDKVKQSGPYRWSRHKLNTTYVTSQRVSLIDILKIFLQQLKKDNIQERASAMAFSFIMAVFPGIIFFFTLIPYIPIPDLDDNIMNALQGILPESIFKEAKSTILDIVSIPHKGLLSFGFLFALYAANNGTLNMINAFNRCYRTHENRTFLKKIWISVVITVFLSLLTFIAIGVTIALKVYSAIFLKDLGVDQHYYIDILIIIRNIMLFMVFFVSISFIYYWAPALHKKWNFFSIGSFLSAVLVVLFTIVFSYYINHFSSYNKVYGSIGTLIGLMLWFYAISMVLLIGFEVNAAIHKAKGGHHGILESDSGV
jgi:membrane protein